MFYGMGCERHGGCWKKNNKKNSWWLVLFAAVGVFFKRRFSGTRRNCTRDAVERWDGWRWRV